MTLQEILDFKSKSPEEVISVLRKKDIVIPGWETLRREYDPNLHPVMDRRLYPDIVNEETHEVDFVSRIPYDLQRLAVARMTELCFGIPVKRVYHADTDRQQQVATFIENIFRRTRTDSHNITRGRCLFAGCEVMTLWYAVDERNTLYGFDSPVKLRCREFSPMFGDELYPLFDESGDLVALSVGYTRVQDGRTVSYFDAYTSERHIKFANTDGWEVLQDENIGLGKIPAIYMFRPTPIWENTSPLVYEIEWAMSRNGNYLRKNSKPIFAVFADEEIQYDTAPSEQKSFRDILQYPKGSTANYITWAQAVDNLKFYTNELRQMFFTQLQLPDWSYEKMSQQALSGESRKQLFIDAQLKVKDESGRLIEFLDREVNVVKAFAALMLGEGYRKDIDALQVDSVITPFTINDEKETIENISLAAGGKPLISQREGVQRLGWSSDADKTMQELAEEQAQDAMNPAL